MARLVGSLACIALGVSASTPGRHFPDEEVLRNQRDYLLTWKEHFNKGDAEFCGNAYLEEASLHAAFGPAAADVKRLAGLSDPSVYHGKSDITRFWNDTIRIVGLKDYRAYEDDGEYASTALVVDDDTVLISGKLAFGGRIQGQILSELWVRTDREWKLRSHMFAIQEIDPSLKLGAPTAVSDTTADKEGPVQRNTTAAVAAVAANTEASGSGGGMMLLFLTLLTCGFAGVLLRRTQRRREATIAGFEAMLG